MCSDPEDPTPSCDGSGGYPPNIPHPNPTPSTGGSGGNGDGDEEEDDLGDELGQDDCTYHLCSDTNLYELGWENFGQAWNIWRNPNAPYGQQFAAGAYMGVWGGMHLGLVVGTIVLTWEALIPGSISCGTSLACQERLILETNAASSYGSKILLQKSLASQAQLGEVGFSGRIIAMGDNIREVPRLVSTYGGQVSDWVKLSSSNFTSIDQVTFEIHWYANQALNLIVDVKTKIIP